MGDITEQPSSKKNEKAVIVRVKRKASQSPLEAFWLEINERPQKRPLLDFEKLSLSDSSVKEESKSKKVFVQHVETVNSSEVTIDVLQSIVQPKSVDASGSKANYEERRHTLKMDNRRHDQLLVKAKQKQENLSKNARFEQIWKSRKGKKEANEALHEQCRLYDVVRVDSEGTSNRAQENIDTDLEDHKIMASYLPLLREFIPSAAAEIESDIHTYISEQDYVYDFYAVNDNTNITKEYASNQLPLVQVDDDDGYYDGQAESEFESDDSNAEDNPLNDYPDEETSEEDEDETKTSDDESEKSENASDGSSEDDISVKSDGSVDVDLLYDDVISGDDYVCGVDDDSGYQDDEDGSNDGDWRWSYR